MTRKERLAFCIARGPRAPIDMAMWNAAFNEIALALDRSYVTMMPVTMRMWWVERTDGLVYPVVSP